MCINFKHHSKRIHCVNVSVTKSCFQSKDWKSCNYSSSKNILNSLLYIRNELLRNWSSFDCWHKFKVCWTFFILSFLWFKSNLSTGILARSSVLFVMSVVNIYSFCNDLAIRHRWITNSCIGTKSTFHSINDNHKMKFTYTFNNSFIAFFIPREVPVLSL